MGSRVSSIRFDQFLGGEEACDHWFRDDWSAQFVTDCVIVVCDSNDGDRSTCIVLGRRGAFLSDGADGLRDFFTDLRRRSRSR